MKKEEIEGYKEQQDVPDCCIFCWFYEDSYCRKWEIEVDTKGICPMFT